MAETNTTAIQPTNGKVITVPRFVTDENPTGFPYDFTPEKLKKKDKTAPDRFAYVPQKPKFSEDASKKLMIDHLGQDLILSLAYGRWRSMAAGWTDSATKEIKDEKGVVLSEEFNEQEFIKYASEFSARGETIKSLLEEKEELTDEIISLSKDTKITAVDKVKRIDEIGNRLNEITETIEFKKKAKPEEAAAEEAAASK